MKKTTLLLVISAFFTVACDSDKQSPTTEKVEQIVTQIVPKDTAETSVATESVKTEEVAETVVTAEAAPAVAPEPAPVVEKVSMTGEQVYKKSCLGCHATGAANAPKLADAAAWAPRIAKGMDALYTSAKNGVPGTAMMAKGTCAACSDDELNAAVDYMVSKSK